MYSVAVDQKYLTSLGALAQKVSFLPNSLDIF